MTTYFVRGTGDNGNSGLDKDNAWATIAYAITQVSNNDVLVIGGGTYGGTLDITSFTNLRLLGDVLGVKTGDAGHVIVATLDIGPLCHVEFFNTTGDLTISDDKSGIIGCIIDGNLICADGVTDCYSYSCGVAGDVILTNPNSFALRHCTILGGGTGASIQISTTSSNASMEMSNCIIVTDGTEYFIDANISIPKVHFDNNIYWDGGNDGALFMTTDVGETLTSLTEWQYTGQDTNSQLIDPELTSYAISSTSPAVNAADGSGKAIDVYGTPRYSGLHDIGCYEIAETVPLPTSYSERRFFQHTPIHSSHYIDSLAEIQRFLAHFYGIDAYDGSLVHKGIVQVIMEDIDSQVLGSTSTLEEQTSKLDNIVGNVLSLRLLDWKG